MSAGKGRRVPRGTVLLVSAVIAGGMVVAADALHFRAARRGVERRVVRSGEPGAVIVLGFANPGTRINLVNRWRARVAVRSAAMSEHVTVICSGGAVRGDRAEADLVAAYLRDTLGWTGPIVTETASRSTWENVANTIPMLGEVSWVVFASGSIHAEKARTYFRRQRPDLGRLLVRGRDHRWGEMLLVKPVFAAVGLWKLATLRRST